MKLNYLFTITLFVMVGCDTNSPSPSYIDKTHIKENRLIELPLNSVTPIDITTKNIQLSNINSLMIPNIVDLNNISITMNQLTNNTPYEISELLVQLDDDIVRLLLSEPLDAYSEAQLSEDFTNVSVINLTTISNSIWDYNADITEPPGNIYSNYDLVYASKSERNNSDLLQIYDRFMMNSPSTLHEVTQQLGIICSDNPECFNYNETVDIYSYDTYFSRAVSGKNIDLFIDSTDFDFEGNGSGSNLWGLATMGKLEAHNTYNQTYGTIWMNHELMEWLNSTDTEQESWQGFVHEYYHTYGFTHDSGWASTDGIDDIFGNHVVNEYKYTLNNRYVLPDTLISQPILNDDDNYTINIYRDKSITGPVYMRLLSPQEMEIEMYEENNKVNIKFLNNVEDDIYLSVYSKKIQNKCLLLIFIL